MSNVEKTKSRRNLIMVISVFLLPIILAKLALTQNWLEYGVTNKGSLVGNELTLSDLGISHNELNNMWLILYALPQNCAEQCEQTLQSVNNTYVALGKEMPKVRNVALYKNMLTTDQLNTLDQAKWSVISAPQQQHALIQQATVLLVDPLGNIILEHKPPTLSAEQSMFGKDILADMKKLLKYSKIG